MKNVIQSPNLRKIITRLRERSYQFWFTDAPQGCEAELMLNGSTRRLSRPYEPILPRPEGESAANGKQEPRRAVETRIQLCRQADGPLCNE